jgi:hypothetical protein
MLLPIQEPVEPVHVRGQRVHMAWFSPRYRDPAVPNEEDLADFAENADRMQAAEERQGIRKVLQWLLVIVIALALISTCITSLIMRDIARQKAAQHQQSASLIP